MLKKHGNRKNNNRHQNLWPYPTSLLEPMYWFWASIEWYESEQTSVPGDDINTTSFAEPTVAFQLITGVNPCYGTHGGPEKFILVEKLHILKTFLFNEIG